MKGQCHPNKETVPVLEACPWCKADLREGRVVMSWNGGWLTSMFQTRHIGDHDYTWSHRPEGCLVPSLARIAPKPE